MKIFPSVSPQLDIFGCIMWSVNIILFLKPPFVFQLQLTYNIVLVSDVQHTRMEFLKQSKLFKLPPEFATGTSIGMLLL